MENSKQLSSMVQINLLSKHLWWIFPTVLVVLGVLFAMTTSPYLAFIATSWIIFGLVAFSLDLVWGKGGDLSLGQTAFFGLGAYLYGIVGINLAPVTGNSFFIVLIFGGLAGGISSALVGYFLFYGRLGPLQTTIITYTLVLVMSTVAISTTFSAGDAVVGGANGMTGIPPLTLEAVGLDPRMSRQWALVLTLLATLAIVLSVLYLLRQPFGLVIDGIRQDPLKTELLGYDVRRYKFLLFTVAGGIAGIAGGFFATWAGYVSPSLFSVTQALLIPIYVLVGGRGSLYGAFVGAIFIGALTFWLGGDAGGGQTTLILGALLIVIVLFAPKGLAGLAHQLWGRFTPANEASKLAGGDTDISAVSRLFKEAPERAVILETVGLNKAFGGVVATDNVSLKFYNQGIHCLIGPNGAGKSTFMNTCVGLLKPDSGQILFDGKDVLNLAPCDRVKLGMGIKLQVAKILEELTVHDNLWLAAYGTSRDKAVAEHRVAEILNVIGLTEKSTVLASELSHGEQQWLDIGMVLCLEPKLIFLDEPAAGMTGIERRRTVEILLLLSKYIGVVVVEHDMDFIRDLDSPVTVLHQGGVFANGSIDDLRNNDDVLDIYLGRQKHA